jgi:hypothetical protein
MEPGNREDLSFGFTTQWFSLGIVSEPLLAQIRARWDMGEDRNPEHYRYCAFKEFLAARRPLAPELVAALFELGATDPDQAMGGAMMADVVRLSECPANVLNAALESGRKHLARLVESRRT